MTQPYIRSTELEAALPSYYSILNLLGSGGMSDVYLAQDTRLNRLGAIKFLNESLRKDADRMRRFSQEARSASALNHPNIITIYDIGETEGAQFIVTEYVEGETLGSRIHKGPIPLQEAVDIAIQIASALNEAHKAGITHRDLKPDNVMLRPDGSIKVLDFGLAKGRGNAFSPSIDLEARTIEAYTTSPGLILGTPQYMSPEQARGLPLDGRSDIFSLGCVVFEMLTGKTAFAGQSTVDLIAAIIGKEPRPLQDHMADPPAELIRIVEKMLRKDRDHRYLTMEHLLSDLSDLKLQVVEGSAAGQSTGRVKVSETVNEPRLSGLSGRWKWSVPVTAAIALIVLGWWFYSRPGGEGTLSPGPMRSVPVTSWSSSSGESVAAAAFSPDARMVAFASTRSGFTEIWVKPTVGGDPIQVTKNGFYNQYPIWSPDGQELAFFSQRSDNNGLWRMAFTGGKELQFASGVGPTARPIRWYDGKIYFQDGLDLFMIDETTGQRTKMTDFVSRGIRPRSIAVSQDGSALAISLQEGGVWKIRKKLIKEDAFTEIATPGGQVENLSFHPNGNAVFYSASVEGTRQVFLADGRRSGPLQISNGDADLSIKDVSSDGSKVLFGSVVETSDLWMVDSQNSDETTVANDVPLEYWPDLSPDGKSVAFQSVEQPDRPFRGSILVKPLIAEGAPTLIASEGNSPTWSNDGQSIAFFTRTDAGYGIMKARPTGADAIKLADGLTSLFTYLGTPYLKKETRHISWSPDDQAIAYSNIVDKISNIWLTMSDGSRTYQVTSNKDPNEKYAYPVWTSDGRSLIFPSEVASSNGGSRTYRLSQFEIETSEKRSIYESAKPFIFLGMLAGGDEAAIAEKTDAADLSPTPISTEIFLLSLRSNIKRQVATLNRAYFYNIHLSNDGKTIAFVTRRNNITEIWTMPAAGGTQKRILVENDPKNLISTLAWSPDNRSIVFGKQTRTNILSMLTN